MIKYSYETKIANCLDCGHTWKSKKRKASFDEHPNRCPRCRVSAYHYRRLEFFNEDKVQKIKIGVTNETKQRLIRRRERPSEALASVIDRLVTENQYSTNVLYFNRTSNDSNCTRIKVSVELRDKLWALKFKHNARSNDEVIWRLM